MTDPADPFHKCFGREPLRRLRLGSLNHSHHDNAGSVDIHRQFYLVVGRLG
jgi:hypothetical protein